MHRTVLVVARLLAVTAILAVLVPALVIGGLAAGVPARHWWGTDVVAVELPLLDRANDLPPEAAVVLLDRARLQDETDAGDLAPSWWDPGAGEVVLGAVTDVGESYRRSIIPTGVAARVERRPYSVRHLRDLREAIADESDVDGRYFWFVDYDRDQVVVTVRSLSHTGLAAWASRYGGAVAVRWSPLVTYVGPGDIPPDAPSLWETARPMTTWLTLATGFPYHLAISVMLVAGVGWIARRRHRRHALAGPLTSAASPANEVGL
jgi:hypothetical protein